mgnify:FL=1|jgi:hypothetical protein
MIRYSTFIFLFITCSFYSFSQKYWQQEVNYNINVTLDDKSHVLYGDISFDYINHSPDTLNKIYIHLWPNAYKDKTSELAKQLYRNNDDELYFGESKNRGYIDSVSFSIDHQPVSIQFPYESTDICLIELATSLDPGSQINIQTPFRVKVPSGDISRLGHIGQSYQITQWYPKPAVYDKNGWNPISYLNQGEFYSEYGSFDVSITLPANYVVGATGDLKTPSEIEFMNQLAEKTKKNIGRIVNDNEKYDKTPFPSSDLKMKTIRFTQDKVHDFAWFADKRYVALKGEIELPNTRKLINTWALFVPQNAKYWQHAIEYLNDGTYYYSLWNGNYPYSHVTAVDGTISAGGGMEYPNITVIGNASSKEELEIVIVHEVGHNWFYGIMGSNERAHGWLDEGLNTLNEVRYIQTKYPGNKRLSDMALNGRFHLDDLDYHDMGDLMFRTISSLGLDQPIETHSKDFSSANYGIIMYQKTGLVFYYLKDYLGDQEFDRIMHMYFNKWKFRHPQPEDLKELFTSETGKNLDWFFNDLIQTTNHIDYKIQKVKSHIDSESKEKSIYVKVKNVGQVDGPIQVNLISQENEVIGDMWLEPGNREIIWNNVDINDISQVRIDAGKDIPELNRQNNTWNPDGLFHKWEPIKLEFLSGDNESDQSNVFWTPSIAGNAYDKLMLGVAFHNVSAPLNGFQYLVAPHYSFGGKRISGISELSYTLLPKSKAKMIKVGTSIKSFSNSQYDDSYLVGISPYVRMDLGNRNKISKINQQLMVKGIWRNDVFADVSKTNIGIMARHFINGGGTDFKWSIEGALTYYQDLKGVESVFRGELEVGLSLKYLRRMDKQVFVRLYAGKNFIFESPYYYNDQLQLSMSGTRGFQDLFLESYYFERNASGGAFWAQQRSNNQGGFSSTSNVGTTQYWLSSCNVKAELPYLPNFIKLFSNHGLFYDEYLWDDFKLEFMYNAGLSIEFGDVFGVYFPLIRSKNMGSLYESYGREIKFSLNFNVFDKGLNLSRFL